MKGPHRLVTLIERLAGRRKVRTRLMFEIEANEMWGLMRRGSRTCRGHSEELDLIVIHSEILGKICQFKLSSIPAVRPLSVLGNKSEEWWWKAYLGFYDGHTSRGLACRSWCTAIGTRSQTSCLPRRPAQPHNSARRRIPHVPTCPSWTPITCSNPLLRHVLVSLLASLPLRDNLHD